MKNASLKMLGAALLALVVAACGRAPDTIDRTQPNYVRKSELLNGSWYAMDTVVDVPPTTAVSFVGQQGSLDKIRFEASENMLFAYRTYEYVPGTDPNVDAQKSTIGHTVTLDGKLYRGAPYGAWKIESHFDRQREYNAATGEQSNVLTENTSDRPWYQREYMRVDWSKNLISNLNVADMSAGQVNHFNGRGYYIQPVDQEAGEDAFTTDYADANGQKSLNYFDFTVKAIAQPETYDYPGYGPIPYCWLNPRVDCEAATLKFRYSFKKVDEDRVSDYVPLNYNDKVMNKFGYFRTERVTYDRNRGVTDSGRILFADRHNIWKKWHNPDGSLIPVEKREERPIVYFLSQNFPVELEPGAFDLQKSWNEAFRRAVAIPKGLEPTDPKVPDMFIMCRNPVTDKDNAACGAVGTSPRLGDVRYNILAWVADPQLSGPLGFGPHGADPETGEVVQAGAYIYGAGMDSWAGDAQTVLDVLTGDISIDDLVTGKNVKDFIEANYAVTDPRRPLSGPWTGQNPLTSQPSGSASVPHAFSRINKDLLANMQMWKQQGHPPISAQDRRAVVSQMIAQNPELESQLVDDPEIRAAVLASAPGSHARQQLLSDPAFYRSVARETLLHATQIEKLEAERVDRASKNNIWMAEFSDDQFLGLAKQMKAVYDQKLSALIAQGKSPADARTLAKTDVYNQLRNAAFRSVAEHEVGHTLGLMHNFQGSYDALNYKDGYWDLRKQTIGVIDPSTNERIFPTQPQELVDAATENQAQVDGVMGEYQYSSIMDYGSRMNADIHGIGKYDSAAILFAYSGDNKPGYVEVFDQTRASNDPDAYANPNVGMTTSWHIAGSTGPSGQYQLPVRGAHTEIPFAIATHYTPNSTMITDKLHYTTLPFMFADAAPFDQMLDQGIQRMNLRSYRKWNEIEGIYTEIEQSYRDFIARNSDWSPSGSPADYEIPGIVLQNAVAQHGAVPVEVPYMFCSDYEVGSNLTCNRWDRGADIFEMTRDWVDRYNNYYAFTNFKRDRYNWGPSNVLSRNYGRLMGNMPNVYQHWLFDIYWTANYYQQTYPGQVDQTLFEKWGFGDPMYQNYYTMAVVDGLNMLLQTMTVPAAGYFAHTPDQGSGSSLVPGHWEHVSVPNDAQDVRMSVENEAAFRSQVTGNGQYDDLVYVPRGSGRSMYTLFQNDGYDFFTRPTEVGHFWDQYASMMAITNPESNFIGVDRGSDAFHYELPYYLTFPKELSRVYSGVWTGNYNNITGTIVPQGGGLAKVTRPTLVHGENFIENFNYPTGSGTPIASATNAVYPSPTWGTRFWGQLHGMAYFTLLFNQDYANQNQIFRLGSGENVTPATGYSAVSFVDPFGSGYTYAALEPTAPVTGDEAAAPYMVKKATALKAKWDAAVTYANGQAVGTPARDAADKAAAAAEQQVREAVRSMEMMRGLFGVFGKALN